jgi:N-acetylneuraminate synthase
MSTIEIQGKKIGTGHPTYIIGEIGLNHNGSVELAKKLVDAACLAGCDAVKFQKRTPEICVPEDMKAVQRETPWGIMSYLDYRYKVEFGEAEYRQIDDYCREKGIAWFASPWDEPSVEFLEQFDPPAYKIASACLTDTGLRERIVAAGRPTVMSTGMSTLEEIEAAVSQLSANPLAIAHCTSAYPCRVDQLNLRMIHTLQAKYPAHPIGYSGHETGLTTSVAAVALGATFLERHITLDRAMWGSDQAASIEPGGLMRLTRDVRVVEAALGDGVKVVYESELPLLKKLRRHPS